MISGEAEQERVHADLQRPRLLHQPGLPEHRLPTRFDAILKQFFPPF